MLCSTRLTERPAELEAALKKRKTGNDRFCDLFAKGITTVQIFNTRWSHLDFKEDNAVLVDVVDEQGHVVDEEVALIDTLGCQRVGDDVPAIIQ